VEVRGPEYVDEAVIIGKSGAKIPHSVCEECKKPKAALYDMGRRRICMDCYDAMEGPLGPPLDIMADDTAGGTETVNERLKRFVQAVANQANWDERRPDSGLIVWRPHPELHVTARRLLDEINGGKQ